MTAAENHAALFARAREACRDRGYWSPYPELPARYPDAEAAAAEGLRRFEARLRAGRFELDQPGVMRWQGEEVSPYTQEPLGLLYPACDPDALFASAEAAMPGWAEAGVETRIGVLMAVLDRLFREHLFELVHAVMHTAGQSYNMSYAGSGVNALDRGLEALVYAESAMRSVTPSALWERRFGRTEVRLRKTYRLVPRGVAVCFTCASFPTWNAWPSMMASLATGNPVIVKPHPSAVLPMAITVQAFRAELDRAGFDPNLVTLALDSASEPLGKVLVKHPATAIVDFTGSTRFGGWVEANAHPAIAYTETAGCNGVVLAATPDLDAVLRSLATTMSLFSAQMCTSPQNIYVPDEGVETPEGRVSFEEVGSRLAAALGALSQDPHKAAAILGAIQSPRTLELLAEMRGAGAEAGNVLLDTRPYPHPEFPAARTATPLMLSVDTGARALYGAERFGPVSFLIRCGDAEAALGHATRDAREFGGLTAFLYATDADYIARAEAGFARAGAQLTVNLTGAMPLNFAAAYSDYHVTGLNPAGNATLTSLAFVAGRFGIAQSRHALAEADHA